MSRSKFILKSCQIIRESRAGYKNFAMNDTLAQLEKDCERFCRVPRFPPRKLAVLGAGSDVGRIACLFLKQQKVINTLAMYDEPEHEVLGVANDIAHIDTSTAIETYQGRMFLKDALYDADVVLICGGHPIYPPCCNTMDRDLFCQNAKFVRNVTIATAQFAPDAIIAVQTPPVDANFAVVKHTLKAAKHYDKRKVLGVNAINAMRANQLFCSAAGCDPSTSQLPVVCGTGRCTRVPCFSGAASKANISRSKIECLTRLVREADELICKVKSNYEHGHLSIGFATARLATNLMKGIFEKAAFIDSALVDQGDRKKCYGMKTCATPLRVGKNGIIEYIVPQLDGFERELLEFSKCDLEDMLNLGRCYAKGEKYFIHSSKYCCGCMPGPCPTVEICEAKKSKIK